MPAIIKQLSETSLSRASRELSADHDELRIVFERYGAPPLWDRRPGFETLLNIILEQQVSLASAKACFDKLIDRVGNLSPECFLAIGDDELKRIGFSRQKTAYARHLCEAVICGDLALESVHKMSDDEAKAELMKLKGVGEWTSDVYLLMAMLRPDVMPKGDIALHAAYQKLTGMDRRPGSDEFIAIAERWRPYRSVAARLLWHFYLSEKRERLTKSKANASL